MDDKNTAPKGEQWEPVVLALYRVPKGAAGLTEVSNYAPLFEAITRARFAAYNHKPDDDVKPDHVV